MKEFEPGMLAKSKAGHDKGEIYVIMDVDAEYVYLADGALRTLDRPKKKKKKHIQIIFEKYDVQAVEDAAIKRILKLYKDKTGK